METNNILEEVNNIKKDFSLAQKIVLLNEKDEILLLKSAKEDLWDLPGGHFDKDDESQLDSLKREIAEEIGNSVDFEILDEVSSSLRKWKGKFVNVKVAYLAKYNLGKIKLSDEHSDFKWMIFDEVENLQDDECKEWLKRVVEKAKVRMMQNLNLENVDANGEFVKTVLIVKAVIINKNKEVLILRRSDKKMYPKAYDLPGGKIEKGETITEALRREIIEETGLKIAENENIIKTTEHSLESGKLDRVKGLRFVVNYLGEDYDEIKLNEDEHESFEWLSFDEAVKAFSDDGFEGEKKESILAAKAYLEKEESLLGWRRTLADFDNYKKRALEREREFNQYASEGIINEMLPVLDNFHAATEHIPEADQDNPWVTGIMFIQKQMDKVFEDNNVTEIAVKIGDEFDPQTMEAMKDENEDDKDGVKKVVKVSQKGYMIKDKIMRPAKVVVS